MFVASKFHLLRYLLVLTLLFTGVVSHAQYSGNIQGVVSDPAAAAINGARVQLRNVDTGVTATTATAGAGNYRFSSLPPGNYVVSAEASGFRKTEISLTLGTAQTQGINVTLAVAASTTALTVTSEAPVLDTDESRIEATLSSDTVRDLPSLNRNVYDVLAVTPGVVGTGTRGPGESPGGGADNFGTQTPQLSANGRSYTGNRVLVDGMDVTSPIQNGNIVFGPVPDSVQEVALQTNSWDAENNLGSSILIQVTTKSGTNNFHGTGNLFFVNQDLQAKNEFAAGKFTPFARKDLVGTLGGPIVKNKTFFFADFEKLWSTVSTGVAGETNWESPQFVTWAQQNFPNTVGTQALTQYPVTFGVPDGKVDDAATVFGAANCGPSATPPIPCNLPTRVYGNFNTSPFYNGLQYNFRFDQYFGQKDRIYFDYANVSFQQQAPAIRSGLGVLNKQWNWYGQVDWTHTFNERVLAEASLGTANVGGANGQNGNLKVPNINVGGLAQGITSGGWGPGEYRGPMYNWRAVLSMIQGKHTWKFGANGAHAIEHGDFTPVNVRPTFNFNDLLQLVQDNPDREFVGAYNPLTGQAGTVVFGGQENPFGLFAQDDWKVKSNLSLTLALRWDDFTNHTPWGNYGFHFSNLVLGSGSDLATRVANASVQKVSGVFAHPQSNLWSPRIGFAWDPTRTGKWSVRGGIGVYHDWVVLGQSVDLMRNNPPGALFECFGSCNPSVTPIFAFAQSGTYPFNFPLPTIGTVTFDSKGGNTTLQPGVTALDRNLRSPFAVNYVVGVEHQLPWKLVAGASYSGSRGYDQLTGTDMNRCTGCGSTRPNTSFGGIDLIRNANASNYNAMILTLRGKPSPRLNFQTSYTFSQAKSYIESGTRFDQDGGQNIPDPSAYFSYYSDANWDVRQRLSFSGTYTFPGLNSGVRGVITSGWELTSIAVVQTGTPFWVINTNPPTAAVNPGDYNNDGTFYDIPNAPTTNFSGSHSRQAYKNGIFTAGDFPAPTGGTEGNLARNIYRNPGLVQIDASVLKNNKLPWLGEQGSLQFRFDFLNVINRVNLGAVDNDLAHGSFGRVTSALSARQIQLGARVSF